MLLSFAYLSFGCSAAACWTPAERVRQRRRVARVAASACGASPRRSELSDGRSFARRPFFRSALLLPLSRQALDFRQRTAYARHSETGSMRYVCCKCEEDLTTAVERAFREVNWGVRRVTIRLESEEEERQSVILTCPNGHTCRYTR
jgi:hypothetical protein